MDATGCQARITTSPRYKNIENKLVRIYPICGHPVKGTLADGTPACGVHINGEKKRLQNKSKRDNVARRHETISRALSIEMARWGDTHAIVSLDDLENIMRKLATAKIDYFLDRRV